MRIKYIYIKGLFLLTHEPVSGCDVHEAVDEIGPWIRYRVQGERRMIARWPTPVPLPLTLFPRKRGSHARARWPSGGGDTATRPHWSEADEGWGGTVATSRETMLASPRSYTL
jgi:hypothetical protein